VQNLEKPVAGVAKQIKVTFSICLFIRGGAKE
jgi:hypothetical protein